MSEMESLARAIVKAAESLGVARGDAAFALDYDGRSEWIAQVAVNHGPADVGIETCGPTALEAARAALAELAVVRRARTAACEICGCTLAAQSRAAPMDRARFVDAFVRFLRIVEDHQAHALAGDADAYLQAEALQAIEGAVALARTFDADLADALSHAVLVAMGRHLERQSAPEEHGR